MFSEVINTDDKLAEALPTRMNICGKSTTNEWEKADYCELAFSLEDKVRRHGL